MLSIGVGYFAMFSPFIISNFEGDEAGPTQSNGSFSFLDTLYFLPKLPIYRLIYW